MIQGISAIWLPVSDMDRAVAFYRDSLGLEVLEHDGDWSEVTAGDQRIGLNASESPAGDGGAVIAFAVEDIETTVDELKGKGVEFTRYDAMDQDELGIWTAPGGARVAWFTDPDGNVLSFSQP